MAEFAIFINEEEEYEVSKFPIIDMIHFTINPSERCTDGSLRFESLQAMKELHEALGAAIVLITNKGEKEALESVIVP